MTDKGNRTVPPDRAFWLAYRTQSVRPLVSLAFVLPLMLIYEAGVLVLGPEASRNGADVLMRQLLDGLGFGQYFLLPLATCAILLGWHHLSRQPWRFAPQVLPLMLIESIAWALLLLVLWRLQGVVTDALFAAVGNERAWITRSARLVAFCGAGLYEELLFRLILLSSLIGILRLAGGPAKTTVVVAVLVSSLVFSAAHYRPFTPQGDVLAWHSLGGFVFRFLAGACFASLYVWRGFGIAAGSHAFYDVIAQEFYSYL